MTAALLTLPRYETIREDLETVESHNRIIQRVDRILQDIEHLYAQNAIPLDHWQVSSAWRDKFMDELLPTYGSSYPAYHQLRVEEVLENLTEMLVRTLGWEPGPRAESLATLVRAWRAAYYKTNSKEPDGAIKRRSENELLFRLDMSWRMRRLHYVRELIDVLLDDLGDGKFAGQSARAQSILSHSRTKWPVTEKNVENYRSALQWVKRGLNQVYADLRGKGRRMRSRNLLETNLDARDNLHAFVESLKELKDLLESPGRDGITPTHLQELLRFAGTRTQGLPLSSAEEADYQASLKRLEAVSLVLASRGKAPKYTGPVRDALSIASRQVKQVLVPSTADKKMEPGVRNALKNIRNCLNFYYDRFEYFDMLTFPILYGTEVGESDEVEIIRISPEDADSLVKKERSQTKLLGTKLMNFGAFFNRAWRENDMLWGRLDGAECLIKAVLPEAHDISRRDEFICRAHQAILEEYFASRDQLAAFQARYNLSSISPQELRQAILRVTGDDAKLLDNFKSGYRVDPGFPPEDTLKVTARMTDVLGKLLGNLANQYPALSSPSGLLSRFGQIFFGILQAALPTSLSGLLFHNLIGWIYLIEIFLLAGGKLLNQSALVQFGLLALLLTLAVHFTVISLRNIITRKWQSGKVFQAIAILAAVLVAIAMAVLIYAGLVYLGVVTAPAGLQGGWLNLFEGFLPFAVGV